MRIVAPTHEHHEELVALALDRSPHATRGEVEHPFAEPHEFLGLQVRMALADDSGLLGWGAVARQSWNPPGSAVLMLSVAGAQEGRSVGSALHHELLRLLPPGTTTLRTRVFEDEERSFVIARHWGFLVEEHSITSTMDLAGVHAPEPPPGVTVELRPDLSLPDYGEVDAMLVRSQTNPEAAAGLGLRLEHMKEPLPPAVSILAVARVDGVPAAISWGQLVYGVFYVAYSGVDPAFRGRGLATLVKQHAAAAALAAGGEIALTNNEAHNAGIRAVNDRLGFRPVSGTFRMVRDLR